MLRNQRPKTGHDPRITTQAPRRAAVPRLLLDQRRHAVGRGASPQVGDAHPRSAEVDTGRRSDDDWIYVILDNLSAHKGSTIRDWAHRNNVELCFTPTYSSWANPIEAHSGPLREFVLNNPNHPNHVVLTRRLHAYLRWRNANANARDPDLLAAQRRERARLRAEKGRPWGRTTTQAA